MRELVIASVPGTSGNEWEPVGTSDFFSLVKKRVKHTIPGSGFV